MAVSYYKLINGVRYRRDLLEMVENHCLGGEIVDSKIATQLLGKIVKGVAMTKTTRNSLVYIRDEFRWTPKADELFRKEIRRRSAKIGFVTRRRNSKRVQPYLFTI